MAHQPFRSVMCPLAHKDATWNHYAEHKERIKTVSGGNRSWLPGERPDFDQNTKRTARLYKKKQGRGRY
jgi:hypothetical protein